MAAELGLTPDQAGGMAHTDLMLLAATIQRRRRNETIRQDARFMGLIAAMSSFASGKWLDLTPYFESLRDQDGRASGEIRDPEQMRLALMVWCAAGGGKIVMRGMVTSSDHAHKNKEHP